MRRMYSKKQLEEIISELSGDLIIVKNIKQLTDEQCNNLKVGDVIAKQTGKQYHLYVVSYKQNKHGLCLTYCDASVIETQSYDYNDGHWVYNSEDKGEFKSDAQIKALAKTEVESATSGTIQDSLGLDSSGNLVKGSVSGGTKLYKHYIRFSDVDVYLFTTKSEQIADTNQLYYALVSNQNLTVCLANIGGSMRMINGAERFSGAGYTDILIIYNSVTRESSSSFTITPAYKKITGFISDTVTEL